MLERFNTYSLTRPRLRKTAGWCMVTVGFIGIVAPIIPGAPLLYIGLEILGLRIIFTEKVKRIFYRKDRTSPIPATIIEERTF